MHSLLLLLITLLFSGCSSKSLYDLVITSQRDNANFSQKSIVFDGYELHYLENTTTNKPNIIFIHGFGADKDAFNLLSHELSDEYHLISIGLAGFGESRVAKDFNYSIQKQSSVFRAFISELHLQNFTLIANSMGGAIALDYASKYPLDALVLIDSLGLEVKKSEMALMIENNNNINPFLKICSDEDVDRMMKLSFYEPPYIPWFVKNVIIDKKCNNKELGIVDEMLQSSDASRLLDFDTKTLIIWGENDRVLNVANAYAFDKRIKHSTLHVLKNCGHVPMIEKPSEVAKQIKDFI